MSYRPFELEVTEESGSQSIVVNVEGELDVATAPQLRELLRDLAHRSAREEVVVDLIGTEFMDLSGLEALAAAQEHLSARDKRLVVCSPTRRVSRVLGITGFDRILTVTDRRLPA
jgi:anti-sigma B factor antagonist